ncbi:MAG: hypothetical protein Q8L48_43010 [Archangium sp.]|nr:hypothetical protein [Archangium sp.]
MLTRSPLLLAALALTLTACGAEYSASEIDPEAQGIALGDANLERLELSMDGETAEVELFFAAPAGCAVVPSTFAAQLNGQALAVQAPGHFGWVMRPSCAAGEQGPECEGTTLTLGCEAPRATVTLQRAAALVDRPLELQVGDKRFTYPVSLSALAWHVVPAADGSAQLSWGGPIAPASSKAVVQREESTGEQPVASAKAEMILPKVASPSPGRVEVVTSVVVSAPGAPTINVTVRQVLPLP